MSTTTSFVGAVPLPAVRNGSRQGPSRPVPAVLPATSCLPTTARKVALVETDRGATGHPSRPVAPCDRDPEGRCGSPYLNAREAAHFRHVLGLP